MKRRFNELCVKGCLKGERFKNKFVETLKVSLKSKEGGTYLEEAVKILIAVVIGALLLAGIYALFNKVIMPTVNDKINWMFNYKG